MYIIFPKCIICNIAEYQNLIAINCKILNYFFTTVLLHLGIISQHLTRSEQWNTFTYGSKHTLGASIEHTYPVWR